MRRYLLACIAATAVTSTACSQDKIADLVNGKRRAPDIIDVIDAKSQDSALMKLYVDIDAQGFGIRLYNTPVDGALSCRMDDRETGPCRHGDRFARPAPGDHTFEVMAQRGGRTIDSAIAKFTVRPDDKQTETIGSNDKHHTLAVEVTNAGFENGAALFASRATTFEFNFVQTPPCDQPALRCALDSSLNPWSLCDTGGFRKMIPPALMAFGAQSLYVQASCGEVKGPMLHVQWYGVPDGYQPLMAVVSRDEFEQTRIELARDIDCPGNSVIWECRVRGSSVFEACAPGGRVDNQLASRYDSVRAACGGRRGPLAGI